MVKLEINKQVLSRIPGKLLLRVARATVKELRLADTFKVSLAFVSEAEIKKLNNRYRRKNKVTDVLSFSDGELVGKNTINLGEIIICYKRAVKQAREHQHSINRELAVLFLHGVLHLLGFDHEINREAVIMEGLETLIINKVL